ncbi:hypothetical protein [Neotamlana laminarinivorans]|uniref:Uncharacterized protein n=1 Tax=Neotamlana laminarinivorans TaxID=2883124 RepID=A0A9X1I2E0_9FLAO|nr:hypothetical protein [Tamlana laminarinivorans]MCB4798977.1 hypothetical protein [Tamlana laminarinivorans]
MKINFYIALGFLLSVSLASAQNTSEVPATKVEKEMIVANSASEAEATNSDVILISADELKQTVARGASDIRKYLTRERKAGNISVVFPKSNKALKA